MPGKACWVDLLDQLKKKGIKRRINHDRVDRTSDCGTIRTIQSLRAANLSLNTSRKLSKILDDFEPLFTNFQHSALFYETHGKQAGRAARCFTIGPCPACLR